MRDKISDYMKRLQRQSNKVLIAGLEKLNTSERKLSVQVIAHLSEVSRRKLHIDMGYPSLFAYCQQGLMLDAGVVWQRLQVANKCVEVPELLVALADGRLSASAAAKLCAHITHKNADGMIKRCAGKSVRDVEEYLCRYGRKKVEATSIRRVPSRLDIRQEGNVGAAQMVLAFATPRAVAAQKKAKLIPATPEIYNFKFSGDKRVKEKMMRLAEVMGFNDPTLAMDEIIEFALECALEKKDPLRKEKRLAEKQARAGTREVNKTGAKKNQTAKQKTATSAVRGRNIPQTTRDKVLARAGHQCEYRSHRGQRCAARAKLQVDHVTSFAKGGSHAPSNLQILCRAHNLRKAELEFGGRWRAADEARTSTSNIRGGDIGSS